MANKKQAECVGNCEGDECLACDEEHQKNVDNCPCRKNCPGELNQNLIFIDKD